MQLENRGLAPCFFVNDHNASFALMGEIPMKVEANCNAIYFLYSGEKYL